MDNNTNKNNKIAFHFLSFISSLLFLALAAFIFFYMLKDVHPGIDIDKKEQSINYNLSSKISSYTEDSKSAVLKDYLSNNDIIRKIYKIEAGDPVPAPIQDCYGILKADEIDQLDMVIENAKSCGLLNEDSKIAFRKDVNFVPGKTIEYYFDETILVICWKEFVDDKVLTCAEVKINDPSQFRRKLTEDKYGSSVKKYCTALSKASNAVVAFNADFYAFRSLGITCYEGTIYRTEQSLDVLFIDKDGNFVFYDRKQKDDKEALQKFVDDNNLQFSLAFGPILIRDGEIINHNTYPIGEINEIYSRAGIGQIEPLHYIFMTVDNYGKSHPPCNINTFAGYMHSKGVYSGYNLDGGQTGELVLNNKIYNLVNWNNERDVSDILFFATALPENER